MPYCTEEQQKALSTNNQQEEVFKEKPVYAFFKRLIDIVVSAILYKLLGLVKPDRLTKE